jgi:hypothetical protein
MAPSDWCKENGGEYLSRAEVRSRRVRHASAERGLFNSTELHLAASVGVSPAGNQHRREFVVRLIVYYVVFMIAGDLAAYLIGLITERAFGGHASLIVFLTLYFLFLWVSWVLAVWMTEPKHTEPGSPESASHRKNSGATESKA